MLSDIRKKRDRLVELKKRFYFRYPKTYRMLRRVIIFILMLDVFLWWNGVGHFIISSPVCPGYIVGDMGGMLVKIPLGSVFLVERDRDAEQLKLIGDFGPTPKFSEKSKITSFAIYVHSKTGEVFMQRHSGQHPKNAYKFNDEWINVMVLSGVDYPPNHVLNRKVSNLYRYKFWLPVRMKQDIAGLESYQLWDPKPDGEGYIYTPGFSRSKDAFWRKDKFRDVQTYIDCGTEDGSPRCRQLVDLYPKTKTALDLAYSRHLLHEWQHIEKVSRQAILSMELKDISECHS
jgi:hypothetical protein